MPKAMSAVMARLSGKIAIVTGDASGIGKAAVDLLRAEGATVVGADVSEGADLIVDAGREELRRFWEKWEFVSSKMHELKERER